MLVRMSISVRWTVLAHLLRPQGRKGELLAELLTDFPERFADRTGVFLAGPGFAGTPEKARPALIAAHWLPVGKNAGRVVLSFAGVDSINMAEPLCGLDVLIPSEDRVALEPGSEYIDDLVGCTVFDGEEPIGAIASVEFSTTPDGTRKLPDVAPLLTVVTKGGDEILIPYAQDFLLSQDTTAREIRMQLPAGLIDLNA